MTTNVGVELLILLPDDQNEHCFLEDVPVVMGRRAAPGADLPILFFLKCRHDEYPLLGFIGTSLGNLHPERTSLTA